jgi:hypothetical protein
MRGPEVLCSQGPGTHCQHHRRKAGAAADQYRLRRALAALSIENRYLLKTSMKIRSDYDHLRLLLLLNLGLQTNQSLWDVEEPSS